MYSLENTLAKIQIHWMLYVKKIYLTSLFSLVFIAIISYASLNGMLPIVITTASLTTIVLFLIIYLWIYYKLWKGSALYVTSHRIHLEINHSIISKYAIDLYYHRLRDTAFSFNSLLGRLLGYGTFFGRSGIGGDEEVGAEGLMAEYIPYPERIKGFINYVISLPPEKRMLAMTYEEFTHGKESHKMPSQQDKIKRIVQGLASLKGVKEVRVLTEAEKDHIWEHEELRNVGVFDTLMRRYTFVFTHDHTWRPAAGDLVFKRKGERIIFPGLPFPEVKEPSTTSASPGMLIHSYLATKIKMDTTDATVFVGCN